MGKLTINESTLTSIGASIRAKTGGSALLDPANMATEIGTIPTYSAADNGKVIQNGTLVEQGTTIKTRTSNGSKSYDTTNYRSITVNTKVPTDYVQYIGRRNDMATPSKVTFKIDSNNWVNGNEICMVLTSADISNIKIKAPVWNDNSTMGGANGGNGTQGGWFTNLFNNGSVYYGIAITIRCAADGSFNASSNLTDWAAITLYGESFSIQYFLTANASTVKFYTDGKDNTIEFTNEGLIINGVTLNDINFYSQYQNGAWVASTAMPSSANPEKISRWAAYVNQREYIYFGVATPNTAATGLSIYNVLFG